MTTKRMKDIFPHGHWNEESGNEQVEIFNTELKLYDASVVAYEKFNELKSQFNYFKAEIRSSTMLTMLISKDLKFCEDLANNIDTFKYYNFKGFINLYPYYKYGWERALYNIFTVSDDMYTGYSDMIDDIACYARDRNENEQELFKELSRMAAETAISGMAYRLYYCWLVDGAVDHSNSIPHFETNYDNNQLELLHKSLEQQKYIRNDLKSWKYWFCDEQCDNPQKIKWILLNRKGEPHKTALREFLMMLCKTSSLDIIVKNVFVDAKGKSIQLAKPKANEFSNYYTMTQEMFDKLSNN